MPGAADASRQPDRARARSIAGAQRSPTRGPDRGQPLTRSSSLWWTLGLGASSVGIAWTLSVSTQAPLASSDVVGSATEPRPSCTRTDSIPIVSPGPFGPWDLTRDPFPPQQVRDDMQRAAIAAGLRPAPPPGVIDPARAERDDAEQRRQAEVAERVDAALAALGKRGNPGLTRRRVPAVYKLSATQKLFGKVGTYEERDVEPAWAIGTFTWLKQAAHANEIEVELATGLTPSRQLVPMTLAARTDEGVDLTAKQIIRPSEDPGGALTALWNDRILDGLLRILDQVGLPAPETALPSADAPEEGQLATWKVGDRVTVIDGPLSAFSGEIVAIDASGRKLKVAMMTFGRESVTEVAFDQVSPV